MRLAPMSAADFRAYRDAALARYAEDVARATARTREEAQDLASAQWRVLLPDGARTAGHAFLHVHGDESEGAPLGALWFAELPAEDPPRLFLYDIHLVPQARGRGLGTRLMAWLEGEARRRGLGALGLSVFRHNAGAVRLYERLGFETELSDLAGLRLLKPLAAR